MTDSIPRGIRPSFPVEVPRDEVRMRFQELLGLDEIPTSVDFSTGKSREEDGLCFASLRYANYMGETISAVLIRPVAPGAGPLPGVVGMPGTGSSAEEVIGPRMYRPYRSAALCSAGAASSRRGGTRS